MFDTMLVLMLADQPFYKLKAKDIDGESLNGEETEWFNLYNQDIKGSQSILIMKKFKGAIASN